MHMKVNQVTECEPFISNYVYLLDSLIHSHEDWKLLIMT